MKPHANFWRHKSTLNENGRLQLGPRDQIPVWRQLFPETEALRQFNMMRVSVIVTPNMSSYITQYFEEKNKKPYIQYLIPFG